MEATHVFKLLSGVECEVTELKGKHQKLLTSRNANYASAINQILSDICVRVGSNRNITPDFVESMLTSDRNMMLYEARQFSFDFPEVFKLPYKYKSNGKTIETVVDVDLSGVSFKPYSFQVSEYSDVQREFELDIKRFEGKVKVTLSDGMAEKRVSLLSKKDISSHVDIMARNPIYFKNETWIRLDLDKLSLMAIEDLRMKIYELEGKVDSDIEFEAPDTGNTSKVTLLTDVNFLFPSGVFA